MDKRYSATAIEGKWQRFWDEHRLFAFDPESDKPVYAIDTPPPTVSGSLHIGHVFSYTHTEIQARFWRMRGFNVFYPMGFDDNGLPSERLTEKELGIKGSDLPRPEFREKCLQVVAKYEDEFRRLWTRLGMSIDWDLTYRTIDERCCRIAQRSFLDLHQKGRIYRGTEPVLWCPECRTAIAQAELDEKELESAFNDVIFTLDDGTPLVIATTRPELLPACVAIFVHPQDERHRSLIGRRAKTPLFDVDVPIMADEHVDMDKGTGVVMCCTYGDRQDVEWWRAKGLDERIAIDEDGTMNHLAGDFAGLPVREARRRIIRRLDGTGLLESAQPISHEVNTHERCGTELEFLPTSQWFVRVLDLKDQLLAQADKIDWHPEHMKVRYVNWVQNLAWDWTISRQRFFGVPFPVWHCRRCGLVVLADDDSLPVDPLYEPAPRPCTCGSTELDGDRDVMDTWATSSLTPQINCRWGERDERPQLLPMALRPQAHEIIRTWAFYTILKSLLHRGEIPWRHIAISGFITMPKAADSRFKAEKISKSKHADLVSPFKLLEQHGADALRLWAANAPLGSDMPLKPEDFKKGHRTLTKLWNAFHFVGMHLDDFNPQQTTPELLVMDRWLLAKRDETVAEATRLFEQYDFRGARLHIRDFFWGPFCDNYLEIVKDRLYNAETRGPDARRAAQFTLFHAGSDVLRLYAPYVPHITEEIYQALFRRHREAKSVHETGWPQASTTADGPALAAGDLFVQVLEAVRRYKSETNQSMRSALPDLAVVAPPDRLRMLEDCRDDLCAVTQAVGLVFEATGSDGGVMVRIDDVRAPLG